MGKIYLLLSQSRTIPARVLKWFTHAEYNHVSLGFLKDLLKMYSFGRRYLYLPIPGGLVSEGRTIESVLEDNAERLSLAKKHNVNYILIEDKYEIDL